MLSRLELICLLGSWMDCIDSIVGFLVPTPFTLIESLLF